MAPADLGDNTLNISTNNMNDVRPDDRPSGVLNMWGNVTDNILNSTGLVKPKCDETLDIPTAEIMMQNLSLLGVVLLVTCTFLTAVTIGVHIEECIFVFKFYKSPRRRAETLSVLSVIPVYSFTSLLAIWVPRSSTLTDLVAAAYFSYGLHRFLHLTAEYCGGEGKMLHMSGSEMRLRSGPCCCLCFCLPTAKFNKKNLRYMRLLVLQTAILKPILMLIAAVLWTNGSYHPGSMSFYHMSLYIQIFNIASTMFAMYGLTQLLHVCNKHLKDLSIRAKFLTLQMVLIMTATFSFACPILARMGLIPCQYPFSSSERADRLGHILIIIIMIPLAIMGRQFYLREAEYKRSHNEYISDDDDEPAENGGATNHNMIQLNETQDFLSNPDDTYS